MMDQPVPQGHTPAQPEYTCPTPVRVPVLQPWPPHLRMRKSAEVLPVPGKNPGKEKAEKAWEEMRLVFM